MKKRSNSLPQSPSSSGVKAWVKDFTEQNNHATYRRRLKISRKW